MAPNERLPEKAAKRPAEDVDRLDALVRRQRDEPVQHRIEASLVRVRDRDQTVRLPQQRFEREVGLAVADGTGK
jgi:hypothetical protein